MELLKRPEYAVARAIIEDAARSGELIFSDERAAAAKVDGFTKCVFCDIAHFDEYAARYDMGDGFCLLCSPEDAPARLGVNAEACKSFAYLDYMPPALSGVCEIKRLAPTLAEFIAAGYKNRDYVMTAAEAEKALRAGGVFGAFTESKIAGFIGRHGDGSMGMLTVFDSYRRRGIGEELERYLITYIMTFGRTPFCDVYADNAPSLALQAKLGLAEAPGYTFWFEKSAS